MAVYQLDDDLWFPDPRLGEPDGLVAIGGDLSRERLLLAYTNGFFPWYSYKFSPEPYWYCPMQRFVIFPKEIHISHSMKQLLKQERYTVTINFDFEGVMHGCAETNNRNEDQHAWLGPHIIEAYTNLHREGFASSVEVWERRIDEEGYEYDDLVGGLYGILINKVFIGESMFSRVPSASKIALIHLARILEHNGYELIDCQLETAHLRSMGGRFIPYEEYLSYLNPNYKEHYRKNNEGDL